MPDLARRARFLVAALLLTVASAALLTPTEPPPFDLLILGARVIDGSGSAWFRSDIGIRNGRIARIGRLEGTPARRVVDAAGRVAAPGFIDIHVHVEEGLPEFPDAGSM